MNGKTFSYGQIFPGRTVLVFVPHEDDEINVAGALNVWTAAGRVSRHLRFCGER